MTRLLTLFLTLSSATLATAQSLNIDVPGVRLRTDAKGAVQVDAANAEVRINDRTVQSAKPGTVATHGGTTVITNGAVVNAAGPGGRSEQVIQGRRSVVEGAGAPVRTAPAGPTSARDGKSFVNAEIEDRDFSGQALQNADFTNATLRRVDFRGANLQRADFTNADMVDCNFEGANLKGANLTNATLENTRLYKAIR